MVVTRLNTAVHTLRPDRGFEYGFNEPANGNKQISCIVVMNLQYISDNKLFDYISPQAFGQTVEQIQTQHNNWEQRAPNLEKSQFYLYGKQV